MPRWLVQIFVGFLLVGARGAAAEVDQEKLAKKIAEVKNEVLALQEIKILVSKALRTYLVNRESIVSNRRVALAPTAPFIMAFPQVIWQAHLMDRNNDLVKENAALNLTVKNDVNRLLPRLRLFNQEELGERLAGNEKASKYLLGLRARAVRLLARSAFELRELIRLSH